VHDKVYKGLGMFRRSCHVFPRDCLYLIYFAFVYPYPSTGIQFWGVSTKYNLDMLRTVQIASIRKIVNQSYTAHCTPVAKSLEILLLVTLSLHYLIALMRRILLILDNMSLIFMFLKLMHYLVVGLLLLTVLLCGIAYLNILNPVLNFLYLN
jgi:hypothetical protein